MLLPSVAFVPQIVESVRALPTFSLSVEEVSVTSDRGESPVEVVLGSSLLTPHPYLQPSLS
jgi:hypothetical protein